MGVCAYIYLTSFLEGSDLSIIITETWSLTEGLRDHLDTIQPDPLGPALAGVKQERVCAYVCA